MRSTGSSSYDPPLSNHVESELFDTRNPKKTIYVPMRFGGDYMTTSTCGARREKQSLVRNLTSLKFPITASAK